MIDLQVYGVVTFTATIDNSLRNLKGGKERERTMKTDFFLQCCAQGPELDRDNEKSANVSKRKKKQDKKR